MAHQASLHLGSHLVKYVCKTLGGNGGLMVRVC